MLQLMRATALALAFCCTSAIAAPADVTQAITLSGAVEHKLVLKVDDLRQLPLQHVARLVLTGKDGATKGELVNVTGVLLRDLLNKAVLVAPGHNDAKRLFIVATASDGYQAVFSWGEIFNSPLGDGVLVFFEVDGKPLGDDQGRIAMISSKDTNTGPRHVKWLAGIAVRKVTD